MARQQSEIDEVSTGDAFSHQPELAKPSGQKASRKVIYAAILANAGIAISKFIVASITGSASMMAEGIHSSVDTGNEALLLLGIKQSTRPPDEAHPFGYGKALYFWALIVALSVFTLGGGISIYHGIISLRAPTLPESPLWNYVVLAVAAVFETYSWNVSRRELNQRRRPHESLWQVVRSSKNPSVFTVFVEDTAALIGIAIAALGIALGQVLNNPYIDPIASILIGLVLIVAAIVLARETGALLVGESLDREQLHQVRDIISNEPMVENTGRLLTMQLGIERVLLVAAVRFRRDIQMNELDHAIARLEQNIRKRFPFIRKVFFDADPSLAEAKNMRDSPHLHKQN